jgi:hypothetical protein
MYVPSTTATRQEDQLERRRGLTLIDLVGPAAGDISKSETLLQLDVNHPSGQNEIVHVGLSRNPSSFNYK